MKTVNLKNKSNQLHPAEVRSLTTESMLVIIKDFDSAEMSAVELTKDGDNWISTDGEYTCDSFGVDTVPDVLIRVPKT